MFRVEFTLKFLLTCFYLVESWHKEAIKEYEELLCENHVILTSVVLSQYTRVTDDRQTYIQHIMTIAGHCNKIAALG